MAPPFRTVTDSLGRSLTISTAPQRIISLCPSQTETLFALGLEGRIVGRTRYCIHPAEKVAAVPVVGGTKKIDHPLIAQLEPDLIIAQMEENTPEDVEKLSSVAPVYVTRVEDYASALDSILRLGEITGTQEVARQWVEKIEAAFATLPRSSLPLRVLYLIWRKPYMAAGASTYIHGLLTRLGWENIAATLPSRYPTLTDPAALAPDLVLLSDEPYPFTEKHFPEIQQLWPLAHLRRVRGDYFSWYGVRMVEAAHYLRPLQAEVAALFSGS
ncbi:MAG: helical backbone metal receptor [Bacteroidia bacterium]|nr:helical backbone metal receptor [Bacteroidia bacterium]